MQKMSEKLVKSARIAIFATSYPPAFLGGGPVRTLEALVKACPSSLKLSVLAPNRDIDGSDLNVESNIHLDSRIRNRSPLRANSLAQGALGELPEIAIHASKRCLLK